MFNTFKFNSAVFNGLGLLDPEAPSTPIVFNGFSLQDSDVVSQILIQDNTPDRDFITSAIPRGDGGIINGDYWRQKTVRIKGVIHQNTNALLEAKIDAMKKALAVPEAELDVMIAGTVRRYHATLVNGNGMFSDRKNFHITFCPFEAEFVTLEPFGYSIGYVSEGWDSITDLSFQSEFTNDGTIRSKPVLALVFSAASGVTAISFKNDTTGEEIKLTLAIVAGDYVKFDSETMEVTVNGVVKDYSGSFPRLDTGANFFTITVTGTSAQYDATMKHKIPFL